MQNVSQLEKRDIEKIQHLTLGKPSSMIKKKQESECFAYDANNQPIWGGANVLHPCHKIMQQKYNSAGLLSSLRLASSI